MHARGERGVREYRSERKEGEKRWQIEVGKLNNNPSHSYGPPGGTHEIKSPGASVAPRRAAGRPAGTFSPGSPPPPACGDPGVYRASQFTVLERPS